VTKSASWWLLTGLVLALVAAANHRPAPEARLDPATLTELSRRLDLAVSGGSGNLPRVPPDPDLSASNGERVSDHH
jgi:hypothetical protein